MTDLSILICTHNRAELLRDTLASLRTVRVPADASVELIVVANACSDNTHQVAAEEFAQLPFDCRCVVEPQPGLSIARNRAVEESVGAICAFLDDDVLVSEQWLEAMLTVFRERDAGIVTGRVWLWWRDIERPEWFAPQFETYLSCRDLGDDDLPLDNGHLIIGCNFAFHREVSEQVGLFRTDLGRIGTGMLAGEETEFAIRAIAAGFKAYYVADAIIRHYVTPNRVDAEYLMSAAYGRGYSGVMVNVPPSYRRFWRQAIGHLWLTLDGNSKWLLSRAAGNKPQALAAALRAAIGRGGLVGIGARLRGKQSQQS